jgi:hypothetical protein
VTTKQREYVLILKRRIMTWDDEQDFIVFGCTADGRADVIRQAKEEHPEFEPLFLFPGDAPLVQRGGGLGGSIRLLDWRQ